jgi:uncharacterized membrane protein
VSRQVVAPAPRWAVVSTFVLSLLGLAVSIYLTIAHFEGTGILACSDVHSLVDCAAVTTSKWSEVFGIPVAVLGLINFVVMVPLNSPWGWAQENYYVHLARFVLTGAGMLFVLWLVYCELVKVGHICLYCTAVHIITFALLIILTRVSPQQLGWVASAPE